MGPFEIRAGVKTTIVMTKVALMVVPCMMQGLPMSSLLPPAARASMYSQDYGLLSLVSVHWWTW